MAAFMYYVLYEQITGTQNSQTGCSAEFVCKTTPFKCLITDKKQPGGPGRSSEAGKLGRKLEEVAVMESTPPAKKLKASPRRGKGRGCKGRSK